MNSDFSIQQNDSIVSIVVQGEFDATLANKLQKELECFKNKELEKVSFDISDVTFMASSGLRVLIFAKKRMLHEMQVDIIGAKATVLSILEMSGTMKLFNLIA